MIQTEVPNGFVYVVDDDEAVRESLKWMIESVGLMVQTYSDAQAFLDNFSTSRAGCLVLDVRMPGMSGLDLQSKLREMSAHLPIIIITGHGDVPMAVRAMKAGAFDFIEKPFSDQALLERVQAALALGQENFEEATQRARAYELYRDLTPREREVMWMVVEGKANKVIAFDLDVSMKTVEAHRGKVMRKMQVRTLSDLVRRSQLIERESE